jgi:hypothetical protein
VKEALQFAFTNGHFDKLRKQYEKQKVYPGIDSLFNKESDCFIPIHPTFAANSEGAKYLNAMKVVAMTFEKREWECLVSGKLNEKESRDLFFKISKESQSTIQTIFLQAGLVEKPSKRSKASDSVSSVALKFGELKARRGAPFVEALLKEKIGAKEKQAQTAISEYFGVTIRKSLKRHSPMDPNNGGK